MAKTAATAARPKTAANSKEQQRGRVSAAVRTRPAANGRSSKRVGAAPVPPLDCADLLIHVSVGVAPIPARVIRERGCNVRPIKSLSAQRAAHNDLEAFILDVAFARRNRKALLRADLLPGAVLLWDPARELREEERAEFGERIYQVLHALPKGDNLGTLVRNLRRRLHLERELQRKGETVDELQKVNDELLNVGLALSVERDNTKLLDLILQKIREITRADAGSIFLVEPDPETGEKKLSFAYIQNDSVPGGDLPTFLLPITKKSIVGFVATTGKQLNIDNAYEIPESADYSFNASVDADTGYWTRSMLTVPMFNHQDELIGVVQLLNKKIEAGLVLKSAADADAWVTPFPPENDAIVLALASQAGVSLENNLLYQEIENLFAGFVAASVQAIESRDPITSGHSSRVTAYTVALAEAVNAVRTGPYADLHFDAEQLQELRYSGLLHDFGKVGVSEAVLQKAKKLYPDQYAKVMMRFDYVLSHIQLEQANARLDYLHEHGTAAYAKRRRKFDLAEQRALAKVHAYRELVTVANEPQVMAEEPSVTLAELAAVSYRDLDGQEKPLLSPDELRKLSIRKGSLDEQERAEIESHAVHSFSFLEQIPWTTGMERVPTIARGHHEFLNGDGYPRGVLGDEIPAETRMMTIADIYDALTASDRPYKRAKTAEEALRILRFEANDNHVDADLLDVFIESGVYKKRDELIP
jgi:HD-GYP domain-containing protein (c-di-GMP phosphodiesterase class II)